MEERKKFKGEWYNKIDSTYFDGTKYELYESVLYGDKILFIVCANEKIICYTNDTLFNTLRNLFMM